MKKIRIIVLLILALTLAACGANKSSEMKEGEEKEKISIVTTIFPQYDWTRQILGERADDVELILLQDKGADLHNYQPTAEDLAAIVNSDLFIYIGGESDSWVEDALKHTNPGKTLALNLMEILEDQLLEGEPHDHDHNHDHDHDHDHDHEHDHQYDEHLWLSLRRAQSSVRAIAEALEKLDVEHREIYEAHAKNYIQQLQDLDRRYEMTVAKSSKKTLLFGDRYPFRYLVKDYNLEAFAAFHGCSAETEASFETVAHLAEVAKEHDLSTVLILDGSDGKIAQAIVDNRKQPMEIFRLNSMQSITQEDLDKDYLSIMEENLRTLKEALK